MIRQISCTPWASDTTLGLARCKHTGKPCPASPAREGLQCCKHGTTRWVTPGKTCQLTRACRDLLGMKGTPGKQNMSDKALLSYSVNKSCIASTYCFFPSGKRRRLLIYRNRVRCNSQSTEFGVFSKDCYTTPIQPLAGDFSPHFPWNKRRFWIYKPETPESKQCIMTLHCLLKLGCRGSSRREILKMRNQDPIKP